MKTTLKKLSAILLASAMLLAFASCSDDAPFDIEGVWALEAEELYFFFDPADSSWKLIDANEGPAAQGEYKFEGEKIALYSDGQLYLELLPFDENVLEFDGGMLGYMFTLDDPQAQELMKLTEAVG